MFALLLNNVTTQSIIVSAADRSDYKFCFERLRDLLVCPERSEIFFGQFHDCMEPVPKSEAAVGQRLLAKLRPTDEQIGEIMVDVACKRRKNI